MTLPRTVAAMLSQHTTLELESIDRMYLNAYVPGLQHDGGVAAFFRSHRGQLFASSALMAPISQAFVRRSRRSWPRRGCRSLSSRRDSGRTR
jgi:hypothetical protein